MSLFRYQDNAISSLYENINSTQTKIRLKYVVEFSTISRNINFPKPPFFLTIFSSAGSVREIVKAYSYNTEEISGQTVAYVLCSRGEDGTTGVAHTAVGSEAGVALTGFGLKNFKFASDGTEASDNGYGVGFLRNYNDQSSGGYHSDSKLLFDRDSFKVEYVTYLGIKTPKIVKRIDQRVKLWDDGWKNIPFPDIIPNEDLIHSNNFVNPTMTAGSPVVIGNAAHAAQYGNQLLDIYLYWDYSKQRVRPWVVAWWDNARPGSYFQGRRPEIGVNFVNNMKLRYLTTISFFKDPIDSVFKWTTYVPIFSWHTSVLGSDKTLGIYDLAYNYNYATRLPMEHGYEPLNYFQNFFDLWVPDGINKLMINATAREIEFRLMKFPDTSPFSLYKILCNNKKQKITVLFRGNEGSYLTDKRKPFFGIVNSHAISYGKDNLATNNFNVKNTGAYIFYNNSVVEFEFSYARDAKIENFSFNSTANKYIDTKDKSKGVWTPVSSRLYRVKETRFRIPVSSGGAGAGAGAGGGSPIYNMP